MKTIRAFLAINLELDTVRAIADEQVELKRACDEAELPVKWVPPQNMHLTIRFLGQVTEPMVGAIKDALERVATTLAPFDLIAAGLGTFPSSDAARVIWVGARCGNNGLDELYRRVSHTLEQTGFAGEKRPFQSHVTIGRIKADATPGLATCVEASAEKEFGTSKIRDLICYRSDLHPQGADYRALWRLSLSGRPPRNTAPQAPATTQPRSEDR